MTWNTSSNKQFIFKEEGYLLFLFSSYVYIFLIIYFIFLQILDKRIDILHTSSHNQRKHISITSALFLCHIRYFLEYVLRRIYRTLEQERSKELYYRKLWHCQKQSIEDVTSKLLYYFSYRKKYKNFVVICASESVTVKN